MMMDMSVGYGKLLEEIEIEILFLYVVGDD